LIGLEPVPSKQFIKDFRRIVQSPKFSQVEYLKLMSLLISRQNLPSRYLNHELKGDYKGYWDCHITNDCVLIYKIIEDELRLARIGTHSDLFKR
jgi:mRNA interferase YafQ